MSPSWETSKILRRFVRKSFFFAPLNANLTRVERGRKGEFLAFQPILYPRKTHFSKKRWVRRVHKEGWESRVTKCQMGVCVWDLMYGLVKRKKLTIVTDNPFTFQDTVYKGLYVLTS